MDNSNNQKPVVLVLAGHDPSGGAGIQADIESIAHAGCHAVTVITSLTNQNTSKVTEIIPQDPNIFTEQIRLILEDMSIAACKVGMIGDSALLEAIAIELTQIKVPLVLDPVMSSTTGHDFFNEDIREKMLALLLPLTTITTPNSVEAKTLTRSTDLPNAANSLLEHGADSVLITGTHEDTDAVINSLYTKNEAPTEYHWERLPGSFHGSGCTLSSNIAAHLAHGEKINSAVEKAQEYTWESLKHGLKLGRGQLQPNRFFNRI